ncbi:hypothetical protein GLOTRDRAFT_17423, partial [Gloeophyllum trabeum ATCC 11539]
METTMNFPPGDGMVAVQGKVYHRIRPGHDSSSIRWILYDGMLKDAAPHASYMEDMLLGWVSAVAKALLRVNPFARALRYLSYIPVNICPSAGIALEDTGTAAEIAAIFVWDNTVMADIRSRRIIVNREDTSVNIPIPTVSRLWEPLAYPLLFPHGTLGWGVVGDGRDLRHDQREHGLLSAEHDSPTSQIWHYRARLLREERFHIFGRLANEYIVDMFTRNLECRL